MDGCGRDNVMLEIRWLGVVSVGRWVGVVVISPSERNEFL